MLQFHYVAFGEIPATVDALPTTSKDTHLRSTVKHSRKVASCEFFFRICLEYVYDV